MTQSDSSDSTARCSRCRQAKSVAEFYPDKTKASGRTSDCRRCHIAARKARRATATGKLARASENVRYYERNRETILAKQAERRAPAKLAVQKRREKRAAEREAERERRREQREHRRELAKERERERQRQRDRHKTPARRLAKKRAAARRAARKWSAPGAGLPEDWTRLQYRRQRGRCYYCGHDVEIQAMQIEHVIALANGGSHSPANCVLSCGPCNWSKSNLDRNPSNGQTILL